SDDFEPYVIELALEQVMKEPTEELIERIAQNLNKYKMVIIHSSSIENDPEKNIEYAKQHNINPEQIPSFITDYLASLTQKVIEKQEVILVLVGGETSYKCCNAISSRHLQLIDEVEHAVPLCLDHKAQWIVTKSGNLGNPVTLVNILKYFERHK
ncbi:MAG: nucleotide-binding domain containing protein, partial [Candidatus Gastranaerophilaceae bacterium]